MKRADGLCLLGLACTVFLSRLGLILLTQSYHHPLLWESEEIANHLLAGRGFLYEHLGTTYRSFNQPLCSLLQAAVYALTNHSHFAMLLVQALFSSLLCITVWAITRRLAGPPAVAWVSTLLVGLHPGLVYYDVFQIVPLSFDAWIFALIVWMLLICAEHPTLGRLLAAGGVMGISALSRGSALLFLIPAIGWLAWVRHSSRRMFLRHGAILTLGMFLVVGPWILRNSMVHHRFIPWINSTTGELFWRGNHPNASGGGLTASGRPILDTASPEFLARISQLDELSQKAAFEQEALRFIREHPAQFLRITWLKFVQFWGSSPQRGIRYPQEYLAIYTTYYLLVALLGILGLWNLLRWPDGSMTRAGVLLLVLFGLTVSGTHSLFYVEGRHRWALEPMMLIFTSAGIVGWYNKKPS